MANQLTTRARFLAWRPQPAPAPAVPRPRRYPLWLTLASALLTCLLAPLLLLAFLLVGERRPH